MEAAILIIVLIIGCLSLVLIDTQTTLIKQIRYIQERIHKMASALDELNAKVTEIGGKLDTAIGTIDAIATDIANLRGQIAAGSITVEQVDAALAPIEAKIASANDKLTAIEPPPAQ